MNSKPNVAGVASLGVVLQKLSLSRPILVCVLLFVIAVFFRWIDNFLLRLDERLGELILTKSLGFLLVLAFVWITGHRIRDIGWHGHFAWRAVLIGTVMTLAAFVFGYGAEFILASQNGAQPVFKFGPIDPKMGVTGGVLFGLFLLVSNFINSSMEDGLFRGVMGRLARLRFNFWKTNLFTAFMFGIWHLPWALKYYLLGEIKTSGEIATSIMFNSLPQFLIGLVYGYLFLKTGSLWAPWAAHTVSNTTGNFIHVDTTDGLDAGMPIRMSVYLVVMLLALLWVRSQAKRHHMPEIEPWK